MNKLQSCFLPIVLTCIVVILPGSKTTAQSIKPSPFLNQIWTTNDLIQPSKLASLLNNEKTKKPLIFNIGVVDNIKGARNIGAASDKVFFGKFKTVLSTLPKNTYFVMYCGCCPFDKCPNIRPAFKLAKDMGFKNAFLLNLPKNIKTDWKDKGYPMEKTTK